MPDNERDPYEYRSVFDGYPYGDDANDWTDRESAEDEAEVFRTLGKTGVRIVCRALDGGSPAVLAVELEEGDEVT